MFGIRKRGLVVRLIFTTWAVLAVVLVIGATVSLRYSRAAFESQAKSVIERQQEIFEEQIRENQEQQRKRLEPILGVLSRLSQKPLLNRSWTGPNVELPSQEQFVENLRNCFLKRESDLRYQCLSRDVELRVQASLLASNQEFLESSIQRLLDDKDIVGVLVLDIDDNPYLGFRRTDGGVIVPAKDASDFDPTSLKIEQDVRIEGDPFGKVMFYYSEAFVKKVRLQMEKEHAKTLHKLREQSDAELFAITRARLLEGLILAIAAAAAVTLVLVRAALVPLNALRAGAELLALGDFKAPIDIERADELGDLARSFSHMRTAILKRIETLEMLNGFGRKIVGLRTAAAIFEACEAFIGSNLSAGDSRFFLNKVEVASVITQALQLPERFHWEEIPEAYRECANACVACKSPLIHSIAEGRWVCLVPFVVRGEALGVFCVSTPAREPTNEDISFCGTVSHLASVTVENLVMLEEVRVKARMEAALNAAEAVQGAIIPRVKSVPNVSMAVYHAAAEKGMGDWYGQYFDSENRRFYLYVADVTGHGIAAALLTSLVAGVVSTSHDLLERKLIGGGTSGDPTAHVRLVADSINNLMRNTSESVDKSLTLSIFVLHVDSGRFSFVNCAHPQPFLVSEEGVKAILGAGAPLGIRSEPSYEVVEGALLKGDRLVFVSDGLVENEGPDGRTFRRMALKKNLERRADSPDATIAQLLAEARDIWRDTPANDDVSIVVVDWVGVS